jgi:zinc/manganese transport system substrate-binding protein
MVPDPHAWQDPRLGAVYARNIGRGLAGADPAGAEAHQAAAAAYAARLEALHEWVRAQVAAVPEARRKIVTSHDAFGYFGAAFGIRFLAPQGVSTEGEPSAQQVANLIRQIRAEGITAVFMENMSNPATLERLAREAGVRVRGRLYADALSEPAGPAPTYEAMFRHNVGLIVPAMRGDGA